MATPNKKQNAIGLDRGFHPSTDIGKAVNVRTSQSDVGEELKQRDLI